mgnify:CR=1 FL=1
MNFKLAGRVYFDTTDTTTKRALEVQLHSDTQGWLGQALTNSKGEFTILTNVKEDDIHDSYLPLRLKIFRGNAEVYNKVTGADSSVPVSVFVENVVYDNAVKDNLQEPEDAYTLLKGKVTLGAFTIMAAPRAGVKVTVVQVLYKTEKVLQETYLSRNGYFEFKIPLKNTSLDIVSEAGDMVGVWDPCISNLKIRLTDEGSSSVLYSGDVFNLSEDVMESDIHLTDPGTFSFFYSDYETTLNYIYNVTGMTEGDIEQLDVVAEADNLRSLVNSSRKYNGNIQVLLESVRLYNTYNLQKLQLVYGLLRTRDTTLTSLYFADETEYHDAVVTAVDGHVIDNMGPEISYDVLLQMKTAVATDAPLDRTHTLVDFITLFTAGDTMLAFNFLDFALNAVEDTPDDMFWTKAADAFPDLPVADMQYGFQLMALTGLQYDITQALFNDPSMKPFLMEMPDWLTLINSFGTDDEPAISSVFLESYPDLDLTAQKELYAQLLTNTSRSIFFMQAIKALLEDGTGGAGDVLHSVPAVLDFLTENPDYDVRLTSIWDYINEQPEGTADISDDLRDDISVIQNLSRLVGAFPDVVIRLIGAGFRSSADLARVEREDFMEQYGTLFHNTESAAVFYDRAVQANHMVQDIALQYQPNQYYNVLQSTDPGMWNDAGPAMLRAVSATTPRAYPTYTSLFGSADTCNCSDCTSLMSPAAYFNDCLSFLQKNIRVGSQPAAFTELMRRRGDLQHIELSCKNSHTVMPYIDLVNEQLELLVLKERQRGQPSLFVPDSFQTTLSSAELNAYPEHTYKDSNNAYQTYTDYKLVYDDVLNKVYFPVRLPFSLPLAEFRTYAGQNGYSRYELMQAFRPADYATAPQERINRYNLASEHIRISQMEADIITQNPNPLLTGDVWRYYGLSTATNWQNVLSEDLGYLTRTLDITYIRFLECMTTQFLNPVINPVTGQRKFAIVAKPGKPADTCIVDDLMIACNVASPLVELAALYDRLHRMVRLSRAGYASVYEVDKILTALGASDLDVSSYIAVNDVKRLVVTAGLQPGRFMGYFSPLNTTVYTDFNNDAQQALATDYAGVYLNKAIINPVSDSFMDPQALIGSYESNKDYIIAANSISEQDLYAILGHMSVAPAAAMELDMLSRITALADIARVSRISVISLMALMGIWDTGTVISGTAVQQLAEAADLMRLLATFKISRFSLEELQYLLLNTDAGLVYKPLDADIRLFYETLRSNLKNNLESAGGDQTVLRTLVTQLWSGAMGLNFQFAGWLLEDILSVDNGTTPLVDSLILPEFINSDNDIIPSESIPAYSYAKLYEAYRRSYKMAYMAGKLRLEFEEWQQLTDNAARLDVLALSELDDAPVPDTADAWHRLAYLEDWVRVKNLLALRKEEFISLFLAATGRDEEAQLKDKNYLLQLLSVLANWDAEVLEYLLGDDMQDGILQYVFDNTTPANNGYRHASWILRTQAIITMAGKLGMQPATVYPGLLPSITMDNATAMRLAAKARYDEAEWTDSIARPLQNSLRQQQRDALTAYVLARPGIVPNNSIMPWETENDLFAFLLMDVEMESCMQTSRIKQAISSVQLFIDRILLQLEYTVPGNVLIPIAEGTRTQWQTWRKWYRIWEANRKIFFYPENWIEPELRDDKTPIFKKFEDALKENEINKENVETFFKDYLYNLDQVARLEPVSCYHDTEDGRDIMHVFARTGSEPHIYFYRKLENNAWTPWEEIGSDIKGNIITPTIWNGRLFIFWITGNSKGCTETTITRMKSRQSNYSSNVWVNKVLEKGRYGSDNDESAYKIWQLRLNWIEKTTEGWGGMETSEEVMDLDITKIKIDNNAANIMERTNAFTVFDWLSKNRSIGVDDIFLSRLYLIVKCNNTDNFKNKDSRIFNVVFAAGLDELGIGLASFVWNFNNNEKPVVVRDTNYLHTVVAPYKTHFYNHKFMSLSKENRQLFVDSSRRQSFGHFLYEIYDDNTNLFSNDFLMLPNNVRNVSKVILRSGLGDYEIAAKSPQGNYNSWNADTPVVPTYNNFFYSDFRNVFFVRRERGNSYQVYTTSVTTTVKTSQPKTVTLTGVLQTTGKVYTRNTDGMLGAPVSGTAPLSVLSGGAAVAASSGGSQGAYVVAAGSSPYLNAIPNDYYRFYTFYHPEINNYINAWYARGVAGVLQLSNQRQADYMNFAINYQPTELVHSVLPKDNVQVLLEEPYAIYNWELFFHVPVTIAQRLSENQQFEEAMRWYHYIFDPTSTTDMAGQPTTSPKRFWKFYPFYEVASQPIQTMYDLVVAIANNNNNARNQVRTWEKHPFQPHVIARMRHMAYMKSVLMKYLDNLIAWGDRLFRQDTIESINEATQLYILAANLLGRRPNKIPSRVKKQYESFASLGTLDSLSNAWVQIESYFTPNAAAAGTNTPNNNTPPGANLTLYFCLPENQKLLSYWDTVADRLFKIRNCMNIDGEERTLALFEPPIDPALLVRAAAMGMDITTVRNNMNAVKMPHYRFNIVVQKANELAAEVKALGQSLLSALEKKDGEALALLRSGNELKLLDKVTYIKELQLQEAQENLESVKVTQAITQARYDYYSSREKVSELENKALLLSREGAMHQIRQSAIQAISSTLAAIPQFHGQLFASVGISFGGQHLHAALQALSTVEGIRATAKNNEASNTATMASYERRMDDWMFQADTAAKELEQVALQLLMAQIRVNVARRELSNHLLQMEQSREADAMMRNKFTNEQLYNWMASQISATYFQCYQQAYEWAKKAEQTLFREQPLLKAKAPANGFVKFGYWDSLRKGLLSGESLSFDLKKMETAYMDENEREMELTKSWSLALYQPEELIALRTGGSCSLKIDRLWLDLDYPGHYLRKIKSVTITIPSVSGPYTTISAELCLKKNYLYNAAGAQLLSPEDTGDVSPVNERVFTSRAQNDGGVFELNFRDERYLPFECRGLENSEWVLRLMEDPLLRQFDYSAISDVIIQFNYTARYSSAKETATVTQLRSMLLGTAATDVPVYFALKQDFSNEWFQGFDLAEEAPGGVGRKFVLPLQKTRLQFLAQQKDIRMTKLELFGRTKALSISSTTRYHIIYKGNDAVLLSDTVSRYSSTSVSQLDFTGPDEVKVLEFVLYKTENGTPVAMSEQEWDNIYMVLTYTMDA